MLRFAGVARIVQTTSGIVNNWRDMLALPLSMGGDARTAGCAISLRKHVLAVRRAARQLERGKVAGVPIVLVTHDLDEAVALSDRICVLDRGETLQTGPPAELVKTPASDRVADALDLPAAAERISCGPS
jgi:ABC-type histidine transport system ATPase subunit